MISIVSLIYRSTRYADSIHQSLFANTEELNDNRAEFFFVANDASDEVISHLNAHNYPYVKNENPPRTEDELFAMGYGKPAYIHRVYRGWNRAILEAPGDIVVLVNSDHKFSPGWLTSLLELWHPSVALAPLTIEPGPHVFPARLNGTGAAVGNCGHTLDTFDEQKFIQLSNRLRSQKQTRGGVYQPIVLSRKQVIAAGLFPAGNIAGSSFDDVVDFGDRVLFRRLAEIGVEHYTWHGSVVYHFNEGEMRETRP